MSERCKHVEKNGFNCGSYAFNLYKDGIDQGNLCDVHYWQAKALAQPEQEPVAYWKEHAKGLQRDYDSLLAEFQAQRTWVGLTDEEYAELAEEFGPFPINQIEAKLKDKNT
jgi:hypothetical protein